MLDTRARIRALIDAIDLAWEQNASEKAVKLSRELERLEEEEEAAASLLAFPMRSIIEGAPLAM